MKNDMILLVFDEDMEKIVNVLLRRVGIKYFTIFREVEGVGSKGLRNNTSVGPGYNITYMILTDEESSKKLYDGIKGLKENNQEASIKLCAFDTKYYL